MLDILRFRENPDLVTGQLRARGDETDVGALLTLDDRRKEILAEVEKLKARRNAASKEVGQLKRTGGDAQSLIDEVATLKETIDRLDLEVKETVEQIRNAMLRIPNLPQEDVPIGRSADENVEVRRWGTPVQHNFEPIDHKTLGEQLKLFDFERGAKLSGSGFPVYTGLGAKLERALIQYFLDTLEKVGYTEVIPPHMVKADALLGTGQLPKFADQLYTCPEDGLYLIPTAEVPVTNLHAGEIVPGKELPIRYCAYTPCFRREAGSWGRDVRGFLRLHQFNKVEMVQFVAPEDSRRVHEEMAGHAESILQGLGLHYRVISLCTGDLGFGAAKCYDIEVWSPVEQKWLECSSVSNFEDYQARRADIRYRDTDGKPRFLHTLNGSGLATPRVLVALIDSYQQADGSIVIPEVLRSYLNGLERIEEVSI